MGIGFSHMGLCHNHNYCARWHVTHTPNVAAAIDMHIQNPFIDTSIQPGQDKIPILFPDLQMLGVEGLGPQCFSQLDTCIPMIASNEQLVSDWFRKQISETACCITTGVSEAPQQMLVFQGTLYSVDPSLRTWDLGTRGPGRQDPGTQIDIHWMCIYGWL